MRTSKNWLVTDTHCNHAMLVKDGHRPAYYEALLASNWKLLVAPQDNVYHLGDVIMARAGELPDILAQLPGTKFLVRGNHDRESNGWYLRRGFAFVAQGILHGGTWLTHVPQTALPDGAMVNVHGHLHKGEHHDLGQLPAHCKLLSLEAVGYAPVGLDEFSRSLL